MNDESASLTENVRDLAERLAKAQATIDAAQMLPALWRERANQLRHDGGYTGESIATGLEEAADDLEAILEAHSADPKEAE